MKKKNKKILIVIGHGGIDVGAMGVDKISEKRRNQKLTKLTAKILKKRGYEVRRVSAKNKYGAFHLSAGLRFKYHASCEFHSNSFNHKARGSEVLFRRPEMSKYAKKLSKALSEAIGTVNRGGKRRLDLRELNANVVDILIEPYFIDNKEDLLNYKKNIEFVAETIANGLERIAWKR